MMLDFFYVMIQTMMGLIYDRPSYQVEFSVGTDFMHEVRHYTQTLVAAETPNDSDGFNTLAAYIGVGGSPQNEGSVDISMTTPVAIDMTAPVVIDMTTPVVTNEEDGYMQFILPSEYDSLESTPTPLSEDVTLVLIDPHFAAVHSFRGWAPESTSLEMTRSLLDVVNATLKNTDYPLDLEENNVELLQYNGPLIWGNLRRNEIKLYLSPEQVEALREINGERKRMLRF